MDLASPEIGEILKSWGFSRQRCRSGRCPKRIELAVRHAPPIQATQNISRTQCWRIGRAPPEQFDDRRAVSSKLRRTRVVGGFRRTALDALYRIPETPGVDASYFDSGYRCPYFARRL